MGLSDRIQVMLCEGNLVAEFTRNNATQENILGRCGRAAGEW